MNETEQTIEALKNNYLAPQSELFIFSDAAKSNTSESKVMAVRDLLQTIVGFKKVSITYSEQNKGLANSVIDGVTEIINQYGKVIVLEDDLVTSPNFLNFMNQALDFYERHPKVISISGYTMNLPSLKDLNKDYYVGMRASSWGWATWQSKWENIDWEVKSFNEFKSNPRRMYDFYNISSDLPYMLSNQMKGRIDSWAIRWCYHQFNFRMLTIFPSKSKVNSIGLSDEATHTSGAIKFISPLDNSFKTIFEFEKDLNINKNVIREFKRKFSLSQRLFDKILRFTKDLKNKSI